MIRSSLSSCGSNPEKYSKMGKIRSFVWENIVTYKYLFCEGKLEGVHLSSVRNSRLFSVSLFVGHVGKHNLTPAMLTVKLVKTSIVKGNERESPKRPTEVRFYVQCFVSCPGVRGDGQRPRVHLKIFATRVISLLPSEQQTRNTNDAIMVLPGLWWVHGEMVWYLILWQKNTPVRQVFLYAPLKNTITLVECTFSKGLVESFFLVVNQRTWLTIGYIASTGYTIILRPPCPFARHSSCLLWLLLHPV